MKTIVFDLDDTLCTRPEGIEHLGIDKYLQCAPIQSRIDIVNELFEHGYIIKIYTSRGMTSLGGDKKKMTILKRTTQKQLKSWGVKYHELIMEKLPYDLWIDDKAINPNDHSFNLLQKSIETKLKNG